MQNISPAPKAIPLPIVRKPTPIRQSSAQITAFHRGNRRSRTACSSGTITIAVFSRKDTFPELVRFSPFSSAVITRK